jgi:hypothetical protein
MKHLMLALPMALFAAAAVAQTDTTTEGSVEGNVVDAITGEGGTEGTAGSGTSTETGTDGTAGDVIEGTGLTGGVDASGNTTGDATGPATGNFGTNWPLSVGSTFFTEGNSTTLRDQSELTSGWQSLSQEDRDMILADCEVFMTENGGASGTATTTATGTATVESPATGDATVATGTDAATTAPVGYSMAQMRAICETASGL